MENYEQKYKEMKKRVLAIGQGYVKEVDYNSPRSIAEYIDPELRESKDERIRKELIQYLKDYPNLPNGHYCRDDFFAWLEKQGEQKPTWSEEDEQMLTRIIDEMEAIKFSSQTILEKNIAQDKINWLNSIKDRVQPQPQPKQEWSEEDENMRQDIISGLKAQIQSIYAYDEQGKAQMNNRIDWLKSIKINHWKPSEEQIGALNYAYCELFKRGENGEGINCVHPLMTLIDDLKKL